MEAKDVKECTDCLDPIDNTSKDWQFWKYEPDTPLCLNCYETRIEENEQFYENLKK